MFSWVRLVFLEKLNRPWPVQRNQGEVKRVDDYLETCEVLRFVEEVIGSSRIALLNVRLSG